MAGRKWRNKPWRSVVITLALLFMGLKIADWQYPLALPEPSAVYSTLVVDRHGQPLRAFADQQGVWRQQVQLSDVSPHYIDALLTYEDRWFWHHPGINPVAILRAAWLNVRCGCVVSGGSTLTMQVARRLHPHSRSLGGKLKQALRALQLEWHLSKEEILTLYLNFAPFGGTIEGVGAASYAYLEKAPQALTRAEAALLAVLPQAPSRLRPDRFPEKAEQARNKVIARLVQFGVWTEQQAQRAQQERVIATRPLRPQHAPLFSRWAKQQVGHGIVATSVDGAMQRAIEERIQQHSRSLPEGSSAAVLVVDNQNQEVRAYVGSAEFANRARYGHVDMVRAIRSPGSTLKPFIYGAALHQGLIHSHSLLNDTPRNSGDYRPRNFGRGFSGPVSVTEALQRSLNLPAVQVLEQLGAARFYHGLVSAGVRPVLAEGATPNLSIALGGLGISLWDLVRLYSSLANEGQVGELRWQTSSEPTKQLTTLPATQHSRYLFSSETAWVVHAMLAAQTPPDRLSHHAVMRSNNTIAWKTGTSYGHRDAWAIGVTPRYTVGVWVGRPDGTPLPGHYGAITAAPVLFNVMRLLQGQTDSERAMRLAMPEGVSQQAICWPLGISKVDTLKRQAPEEQPSLCHQEHAAWIIRDQVPPTFSEHAQNSWQTNPVTLWLNADTGLWLNNRCTATSRTARHFALWPRAVEPWLPRQHTRRGQIPAVDPSCSQVPSLDLGALSIVGITNGNEYRTPRDNAQAPVLQFSAIGGIGQRDWFVNGDFLYSAGERESISYELHEPGRHEIVVIDSQGNLDRVEVVYR